MKKLTVLGGAAVAAMMALSGVTGAAAAEIPCSTAKLIVPWKAGGGTHIIFSVFEETIKRLDLEPKVQVVTIPGQGGNKGAKEARKAKADGCTLFAIHQSAIVSYLNGRVDFTWDAFDMVAQVTSTPELIGASGSVPWQNFNEMIAAAKAEPETLKLGATFGSTSQFMWVLLEGLTGAKFKYVPFDGTRERITALLADTIELGTINVPTARKYVGSGELKAFAIAADERSHHLPGVPTLKELGVDMTYALDRGKKASEDPEMQKALAAKGTDVKWVGPEGYAAWFKETYDAHEKVAIEIGMFKKN
jgi:tripartite-type tricarboxylate transporter receptor subunit TctC